MVTPSLNLVVRFIVADISTNHNIRRIILPMNEISALRKAIEFAGSQAALADKMTEIARNDRGRMRGKTFSQQNISSWLHRSKRVSPECCRIMSSAVDGWVTPHDLRPDIFYSEGPV